MRKHLLELDVLAEADDAALLGRAVARLVLDPVVVLDVRARAAERRVLVGVTRGLKDVLQRMREI